MFAFWKLFIENNRFSYLIMVALIGFGIFSIISIPKENAPEVIIPIGVVVTVLPGASAADIESLITNKIEQGIEGNLENLKRITSTSRTGISTVVAEFEADADVDASILELKDEIDTIVPELPDEAEDPFVTDVNFVDQPILTVAISGELSDLEFSVLADELEAELERIQNVSRVETSGARDREVTIIVDQTALQKFELSLSDVVSRLRIANTSFPVGAITTSGVSYNIAFEGDIESTSEIPNIPLGTRGGVPIFVRDIATIEDGLRESSSITRLSIDGEPSEKAILLNIYKSEGGDITKITGDVNAKVAELQEPDRLLAGLGATSILDSGDEIKKELTRLTRTGLTTVSLVVILLIFAIGWHEGLIAGLAIPLSFTIGFVGLYVSGNTINFVSLFALILAVGILVDSSIVMVEGIHRRMKDDVTIDKTKAALLTIREFAVPLTAGTLTTVAMFSGLFLVGGVSGQFISAIPFTVNFILFASLLVALGFIPLIASLFLHRRDTNKLEILQHKYSLRLESWYRKKLEAFLVSRRKKIIFLSSILIGFVVAISLPIVGAVKVVFFEQADIDWIFVEVEMPQGTDLDVTDVTARKVEEVLYAEESIESYVTTVGASSAFSSNSGSEGGEKLANFLITLRDDRSRTSTEILDVLRDAVSVIPEGTITVGEPNNGPPTGAPIEVRFLGDDLQELSDVALRAAEYLKTMPGSTGVETSTNENSTEFVFNLNRAKAAQLGLDPFTISQALRTAVSGSDATSITTTNDDIDIVVKLALNREYIDSGDTSVTSVTTLENLEIPTQSGGRVLLGSVTETSLRESSEVISHEDGKRIITLTGDVTLGSNAREINAEFLENVRSEASIPDYIELSVGGENEESNEAFRDMFIALIVGLVGMLIILVLQFNSYRHTAYVLSIIPFSLIGIMAGLFISQLPLSFPSLMGFIALSGIVVNNSILLIDQMNNQRRKFPEKSVRDAVVDAAVSRLRPILLTTVTTVVGIYPLTFASDLWAPLAWAVMFGLSFSVIITLLLIPIIYNRRPGKVEKEIAQIN